MKTPLLILLAGMALAAPAQTVVTNYYATEPHLRRVSGTLYNTGKSVLWSNLLVRVVGRSGDFLRVAQLEVHTVYESRFVPGNNLSAGSYGAESPRWRRFAVGEEKRVVKILFLKNYTERVSNGMEATIRAMRVGVAQDGTEIWDCGTVNIVAIIRTNPPPKLPK